MRGKNMIFLLVAAMLAATGGGVSYAQSFYISEAFDAYETNSAPKVGKTTGRAPARRGRRGDRRHGVYQQNL